MCPWTVHKRGHIVGACQRTPALKMGTSSLRLLATFGLFLLASVGSLVAKDFEMPAAQPARTYPAHDEHSMEKVSIAVEPYDGESKAAVFSVKFRNYGYIPVFFVITNDGDEPISLVGMKAQLNTRDRSKLLPSSTDDLLRRISSPKRNDRQLGIPLPKKEVKGGVNAKTSEEIDRAQFGARAVEPHSTARGFLFFDVTDISDPLSGATFFLTGVHDSRGKELMYFEIPMEKYLNGARAVQP